MTLRLAALAALLASTLASAADAPSQLALAECRLGAADAIPVLKAMTQISSRTDDKEGEESDVYDFKLDDKPLGMTASMLTFTSTVTEADYQFLSIHVFVDGDFDTAKAKLSTMRGTTCETKKAIAPDKYCSIKGVGKLRNIELVEVEGKVSYLCGL